MEIIQEIEYHQNKAIPKEKLVNLYEDVQWLAYTKEPEKLFAAIGKSLKVITAWEGEELIGLIRAVGDGLTIVYIQDILVKGSHQGQGVGEHLMQQMLSEYEQVRQTILLTDDTEKTRSFYNKVGFQACDDGKLIAFAKFNS